MGKDKAEIEATAGLADGWLRCGRCRFRIWSYDERGFVSAAETWGWHLAEDGAWRLIPERAAQRRQNRRTLFAYGGLNAPVAAARLATGAYAQPGRGHVAGEAAEARIVSIAAIDRIKCPRCPAVNHVPPSA